MNYNSINEILEAGTTNMEVLRDNTKQDDGVDTIAGIDWFTFDGAVASTIYASGNSFIGFGANSEHLKVNRKDGAMYSLYREEGTLYNYYNFLKIRWVGYSGYSSTSTTYALTYDVILWSTGDISLHMISIPTSENTGTYSLIADSTYKYTVSTSAPDITFIKTDSGFEVNNSIIELVPVEQRYLIRSNSTYYTVTNNNLEEISVTELTSSVFLNFGTIDIPNIDLISNLSNPEILYWCDIDIKLEQGLVIKGTPTLPQIIYYEQQNISNYSGIEKAEVVASDDVIFVITFDDEQTWKYYDYINSTWSTATTEFEGMSATAIKNIPLSAWTEVVTSTTFSFRCTLPTVNSTVSNIYIKYVK